ncbi:MAG TPA: chromosome segregation protein SMC, partial [Candidatus Limnocylindria bacterium]|nr:chromosome segregation protein SMC [Candidatus Limnocylindria bacterium]
FKTFADPTRFVFEPGVNAVIGPNGSGKSNMADAVRWVLGEQSNRSLRTRRADDVIFAGSQQRKAQGMAEAILTLDNADGWLPIDFSEVSIGRRAYRSGESEYLINGARARLRDVVELLGEGRLGANELVVVGQGTVDAALSLRPEERRQLFEEAAGVKNLQVRKNEALSRLARARDNLTRVNDLVGELKPQVRRLALQAQHQQEHDSLLRRARAFVSESHHRRERVARGRLGDARRAAAAAEAELEALRVDQQRSRAAVEEAQRRYWQAEEQARQAGRHRESTREEMIRAEGRVETLTARRDELVAAGRRGDQELAELEAALAKPVAGPDAELEPALQQAAAAERDWQAAIAELAAADDALLQAEDALAEARRHSGERLAAEARRQEALIAAQVRRQRLEPELAAARAQLQRTTADLDAASTAHAASAPRRETAAEALQGASRALADAEAAAGAARQAVRELELRHEAMRVELTAIEDRGDAGGRLGGMLVAAGWQLLLDVLDAPDAAWPAIEAIVGGELGETLLDSDGNPEGQLGNARGSARLLRRVASQPPDRDEALRAVGGERTLAEWIGATDVPEILMRTVVAADLAALRTGWSRLPVGWLAVTPDGDVADGRGLLILRGRADAPGGHAARRHARRRELIEGLERLDDEASRATTAAEAAGAALATAEDKVRAARQAHADAERMERDTAAAVEASRSAQARAEREAGVLREEAARAEEAEAAASDMRAPAVAPSVPDLEGLTAAVEDARTLRNAIAARRDEARAAWSARREAAQLAEVASAGQRQERSRLEARHAQLGADLPVQRSALSSIEEQHRLAVEALNAARGADQQAATERDAADAERERLRAQLLEQERGAGGGGIRLGELERAAQTAAIEASRQEETLAALARERELALEGLPDASDGDSPAPIEPEVDETIIAELDSLDDERLETELRRVRRTLAQIGSVNPFAVEEHAELSSRLDELTSQDADLGEAISSTDELVARLDLEIGERFNAAFAAIGSRFDEFCQLLFAGGSASLQMSDGSDGEAPGGIEIVVRPPGKRLQRLAMLSGGERALTGVALLFAMLSVNPVPFCILDEVDAALDEANIGRFADALRKLSESTDFVVITHNRATIEVADTIYGVTMTDAAVSRILSLRLADVPLEVGA